MNTDTQQKNLEYNLDMEKQVGLLLMKDENDILYEYLTKIVNYFDTILVLDGSEDDEGREICSKFSEVVYYEKDSNLLKGIENRREFNLNFCDSIRGFLFEKAKEIVPHKKWVAVLHPDEFPSGDPLVLFEMMDSHYPHLDSIVIRNVTFFPHTSQEKEWRYEPGDFIEPLMKYCMAPGWPEWRYFRMNLNFSYENTRKGDVVPLAAKNNYFEVNGDFFYHKHIFYRSEKQILKRAQTRIESGWQDIEYVLNIEYPGKMFFDTLKFPPHVAEKYPNQHASSYHSADWAYVKRID